MIVKLLTADYGWVYFPVTSRGFKVRKLTFKQWETVLLDKDNEYLEIRTDGKSLNEIKDIYVIYVFDVVKVYTNSIAFLINDEGKTIEKLT